MDDCGARHCSLSHLLGEGRGEGEAGTGKTLIARAIHRLPPRAATPLATIDPAALWAHGEAALPAALASVSAGGAIFLDEIAGLPTPAQSLLLAFLGGSATASPAASSGISTA